MNTEIEEMIKKYQWFVDFHSEIIKEQKNLRNEFRKRETKDLTKSAEKNLIIKNINQGIYFSQLIKDICEWIVYDLESLKQQEGGEVRENENS